jgi:hypothetical protein
MQSFLLLSHSVDDVNKLGEKRGASHKEAVNVWAAGEICSVGALNRASVHDADLLSYLFRNVLLQPGADLFVGLLGLFGGSCFACSNGPDRFVGLHFVVR